MHNTCCGVYGQNKASELIMCTRSSRLVVACSRVEAAAAEHVCVRVCVFGLALCVGLALPHKAPSCGAVKNVHTHAWVCSNFDIAPFDVRAYKGPYHTMIVNNVTDIKLFGSECMRATQCNWHKSHCSLLWKMQTLAVRLNHFPLRVCCRFVLWQYFIRRWQKSEHTSLFNRTKEHIFVQWQKAKKLEETTREINCTACTSRRFSLLRPDEERTHIHKHLYRTPLSTRRSVNINKWRQRCSPQSS